MAASSTPAGGFDANLYSRQLGVLGAESMVRVCVPRWAFAQQHPTRVPTDGGASVSPPPSPNPPPPSPLLRASSSRWTC